MCLITFNFLVVRHSEYEAAPNSVYATYSSSVFGCPILLEEWGLRELSQVGYNSFLSTEKMGWGLIQIYSPYQTGWV